ncbi:MAG: hypothetical protein ACK4N5_09710, partial [Myxococcales bacterium]
LKALAQFDAGSSDAAEASALRALELDEKSARAVLVLGMVYQSQNDAAKAKVEYQRYLELEPKGAHASEVKAILAGL